MSAASKPCDVVQGFNFKKDQKKTVGFATKLKIADKQMTADLPVKNPCDETDLKAVLVLSGVHWDIGNTDPLHISGQISAKNKEILDELLLLKMGNNVDVEVAFSVYQYDPVAGKNFSSFSCTQEQVLKGYIKNRGESLAIEVDEEASRDVPSPINFGISFSIQPNEKDKQNMTIATRQGGKVVKTWGAPTV